MNEGSDEVKKDKKRRDGQTQFRLVLKKDSMDALDAMVMRVNEGFTAGCVSRADLASYLFKNIDRYINANETAKIRAAFYDEKIALENILKKSQETGDLPEEIRKALKNQFQSALGKR